MDMEGRTALGGGEETCLWADLLREVSKLSRLYLRRQDDRRFLRCEAILKTLEALLRRFGQERGLAMADLLKAARCLGAEEDPASDAVREAAGWWHCVQASFRLAFWYGLSGDHPELALRLADVHRDIRAGVQCVYPDAAGKGMIRAATAHPEWEEEAFLVWARNHLRKIRTASLLDSAQ